MSSAASLNGSMNLKAIRFFALSALASSSSFFCSCSGSASNLVLRASFSLPDGHDDDDNDDEDNDDNDYESMTMTRMKARL